MTIGKQLKHLFLAEADTIAAEEMGLIDWAKKFCPDFLFRSISEKFHVPLCHTYDTMQDGENYLIIVPRGNAKTTWTQLMLLRATCEKRERYILIIMDSSEQAEQSLATVKEELESNELLKQVYGSDIDQGAVWAKAQITTQGGVTIQAVGKGKKLRGRRYRQFRPTLVVCDDPQNEEDVESPAQLEKDWRWFTAALKYAGDSYTKFVVIGTMLHKKAIVAQCERLPSFKVFRFRAIQAWPRRMEYWNEWKELYMSAPTKNIGGTIIRDSTESEMFYKLHKDLMDEGASVLWEEKESLLDLMKNWAEDSASFMAEKQNEPFDPSRSEFNYEWLSPERTSIWYDDIAEFEKVEHFTVGFVDWAHGKQTRKGDFAAIVILHYTGNCCYVECDIQKAPVVKTVHDILGWHKQVNFVAFGCETQGFQQLAKSDVVEQCQLERVDPSFILEVENGNTPKAVRIARLSAYLQRGFYKFKRNCRFTEILLEQLLEFPNPRAHDDGPDGLEGATRVLYYVLAGGEYEIQPLNDEMISGQIQ